MSMTPLRCAVLAILAWAHVAHAQASTSTTSASSASATPCSPLELVVARGTNEGGDLGVGVGDPLLKATDALIPGATGYRVDYPALLTLASVSAGIADVVAHVKSQTAKCPDQKLVLVGYSQGGFVMLGASKQLNPDIYSRIVAVTQFGDPGNRNATDPNRGFPAPLGEKLKENCIVGDPICTNNGTQFGQHGLYDALGYVNSSAQYIKKQYDTDGHAGPSPAFPGPGERVFGNAALWCGLNNLLGLTDSDDCKFQASSSAVPASSTSAPSNSTAPTMTGSGSTPVVTGNSTSPSGTGQPSGSGVSPTAGPTMTMTPSAAGRTAAIPAMFYLLAFMFL